MGEIDESWVPPIWAPDTLNYRKFFNASMSGDMQAMKEALTSGEINVNACPKWEDWEGETALHRAAEYGHLGIVQKLISHGAEVDRRDVSPLGPTTALHFAAHEGHIAIVNELLQNGADVNTRGQMGGPLLNFVLWLKRSISDKEYKIIDLILSQGNYDIHSWLMDMGGTILHHGAEIRDLKLIRYLVDRGADCNYIAPTYEDYTVLYSAVIFNKIEACRLLIELGARVTPFAFAHASCMDMVELLHPHLNQSEISTCGILNYASKPEFLRELLASQIVDVNDLDLEGESALLEACTCPRSSEILRILLDFGADLHVRGSQVVPGRIFKGDTPLHRAVVFAPPSVVNILIQAEADLEARNELGHTPLIRLAISDSDKKRPRTEIFEILIKKGIDVNVVDSGHNTALHHLAIQNMHTKSPQETLVVFQLLVKAGALTSLVNLQGETCLELFSSNATFRELVRVLTI